MAGKGGRERGMPRRPSHEAMSAVSSPHTKAPPPSLRVMPKLKSVPSTPSPSNPWAVIWAMAVRSRAMARW